MMKRRTKPKARKRDIYLDGVKTKVAVSPNGIVTLPNYYDKVQIGIPITNEEYYK